MLPFDDKRWDELDGGYRDKCDPRPALNKLRHNDDSAWDELWNDLHHQGDVGVASYAAVPHLVEIHRTRDVPAWQTYALLATIELCRSDDDNPKLPKWLQTSYEQAWKQVVSLGCRDLQRVSDETTIRSIYSAIALAKGVAALGEIILTCSAEELLEFAEAYNG